MEEILTVLIHAYNQEAYIGKCIDSILVQEKSKNFDIWIVDDFSSDGTIEILRRYAEKFPTRIRLFLNTYNHLSLGQNPFGHALQVCKSKYIAFCDGDDYWIDKEKLSKQLGILENHRHIALVHTGYMKLILEGEQEILRKRTLKEIEKAMKIRNCFDLVQGNDIKHSTVLVRRETIDLKFVLDAKGIRALDWIMYVAVTLNHEASYLEDETVAHRIHPKGIWNGSSRLQMNKMKSDVRIYCARSLPKGKLRRAFRVFVVREQLMTLLGATKFYFRLRLREVTDSKL